MPGVRRSRDSAGSATAGGPRPAPAPAAAAEAAPEAAPAAAAAGPPRAAGPGGAWRDPVAWAMAAAALAAYFTMSLFRLLRADPASWDLGIYTEYVKQLALLRAPVVDVRGPGFNLLGDHFQIAVAVIAPFFRLFPTPATLLFFQAACAAVSVFPVVSAGTALAGRAAGRLIGLGYAFSWGLQQMAEFDFHEIALAVPLLAFSLSALVRGRVRAAALWAAPLVFVKEDQGFTVAAIGGLLLAAGTLRRPGHGPGSLRWGAFLACWGLLWSLLAIFVIIPHFNPDHVYYYWKDGGVVGGGPSFSAGGLAAQALGGWATKAPTVFLLLLPTAFAAAGSPLALVALPGLALRFISTNTAYWGTDWHYNATAMPILFLAAAEAIARWRAAGPAAAAGPPLAAARRAVRTGLARHGPPMMAAVAVALAFQFPVSSLWHASTYRIGPRAAADSAAVAVVPSGASVQATLDLLAPLAARADTFWIGNSGNPATRYIVFDSGNSGYTPAVTDVPAFISQLYPRAGYVQVFARDGVYVFRRA